MTDDLIDKIAARVAAIRGLMTRVPYDAESAKRDLSIVHAAYDLKLDKLLAAHDEEFIAVMFGIRNNLNRLTGDLGKFRLPHTLLLRSRAEYDKAYYEAKRARWRALGIVKK